MQAGEVPSRLQGSRWQTGNSRQRFIGENDREGWRADTRSVYDDCMHGSRHLMFGLSAALLISACDRHVDPADASTETYNVSSCGGAPSTWSPHGSEYGELVPPYALAATPKGLTWNAAPINAATARDYLRTVGRRVPGLSIQVVFDPHVSCIVAEETRALVNASRKCGRNEKCVEYSRPEYEAQVNLHDVE